MGVTLFKQKIELKDGKSFYSFYLRFANGETLKIQPNNWTDKEGKKHSNYDKLVFVAETELPFDK